MIVLLKQWGTRGPITCTTNNPDNYSLMESENAYDVSADEPQNTIEYFRRL